MTAGMNAEGDRGRSHAGSSRSRPDLGQWQGNPDDLWPGFGFDPGRISRPDRRDRQRDERVVNRAQRHPDRLRSRLTRDEIVDAAIAIADAEGAEALSMRRIAQVLRSGTMSLYWHVANKEHLLDLMRDMLMAEITVPEPSGDWRADLRALAISTRAMLRRHTWLMDFIGGRPPLGPNTLLGLERSLAAIADLKLEPAIGFDILTSINTYVSGVVLREVQEIRTRQVERQSGLDPDDVASKRQAWRDQLAATGLFRNFIGFLDADIDPDAPETMDQRFEFGLDCLLDGIAARIASP
jgi:AcrR family transcriptional regulator